MKPPRGVLTRSLEIMQAGLTTGAHIGAQFYVSVRGEPVADVALGEARAGVPMRTDTILWWMSSVKPVAAVALAQLRERGKVQFDDPVTRYLPEFAVNGKDQVTLRHLLTHTGGFRNVAARWQSAPWDELVAKVCAAKLEREWAPGQRAGYHPATGWVVLGEIIRRVDGRMFDKYARTEIFLPLGMNDSWAGMPRERYQAYGDRIGILHDTTGKNAQPLELDSAAQAALVRPGSNGRGPIRELGRFYEMLWRGGEGVLRPDSVQWLTTRQRTGLVDETFNVVLDWGLGFIIDSKSPRRERLPYGYGRHASANTFGHSGNQSSVGFCDPVHDLVVAWICNGMVGEDRHQERADLINSAIYEDLGLQRVA